MPPKSIAVLIDADNTQLSKLDQLLAEISTRGRIVVKRAYGNWRKDLLNHWESALGRLAIKAEQQFDYVSGKNATDMALVIDAMDLLAARLYDMFVIVSSDSDFTPLAIKLRESGAEVIGVGNGQTSQSFRNACDDFLFLENLGGDSRRGRPDDRMFEEREMAHVHDLLERAWENYQDEDGWANAAPVGNYLKRAMPDFDARSYGFAKLSDLIKSFPGRYATKTQPMPPSGVPVLYFRCR